MRRITLILIAALFLIVVFLSQVIPENKVLRPVGSNVMFLYRQPDVSYSERDVGAWLCIDQLELESETNGKTSTILNNGRKGIPAKCQGKKDPFRHKILKMAIYYTDELKNYWIKQKKRYHRRRPATVNEAVKNLIKEANKWFTSTKLGNGNSVKIVIKDEDIRKISATDARKVLGAVGRSGLYDSTRPFCEYAYRNKRRGDDWNLVFFFSTMSKDNWKKYFTNSVVREIKGICQTGRKLNCGIALQSTNNPETFNIHPPVWSHEIGHELGLKHFCTTIRREKKTEMRNCLLKHGGADSIMISPASAKYWYKDSKNLLNSYFKNPNDYSCLKWECEV